MINGRELRIGNIATVANLTGSVTSLTVCEDGDADITMSFSPGYDYSPEQLDPVPLSEEWLEKIGFETVEENWEPSVGDAVGKLFYNNMSVIRQRDTGKFHLLLDGGPDEHEYGFAGIELKAVHQLQNLYFALTGEELPVKE
ncbi:MAG TPA: hypothetical protein VFE32_17350 [Puia sp.]|jgi:hypothetical protein|nr:hypothetical protein [Puia sp.]